MYTRTHSLSVFKIELNLTEVRMLHQFFYLTLAVMHTCILRLGHVKMLKWFFFFRDLCKKDRNCVVLVSLFRLIERKSVIKVFAAITKQILLYMVDRLSNQKIIRVI